MSSSTSVLSNVSVNITVACSNLSWVHEQCFRFDCCRAVSDDGPLFCLTNTNNPPALLSVHLKQQLLLKCSPEHLNNTLSCLKGLNSYSVVHCPQGSKSFVVKKLHQELQLLEVHSKTCHVFLQSLFDEVHTIYVSLKLKLACFHRRTSKLLKHVDNTYDMYYMYVTFQVYCHHAEIYECALHLIRNFVSKSDYMYRLSCLNTILNFAKYRFTHQVRDRLVRVKVFQFNHLFCDIIHHYKSLSCTFENLPDLVDATSQLTFLYTAILCHDIIMIYNLFDSGWVYSHVIMPKKKNHYVESAKPGMQYGGDNTCVLKYAVVEPYITSESDKQYNLQSTLKFVAHVADTDLHCYMPSRYIHTRIPLETLFEFIPLSEARKIGHIHGLKGIARCKRDKIVALIKGHSCMRCTQFKTIFVDDHDIIEHNDYMARNMDKQHGLSSTHTDPFPPAPINKNLAHHIITSACKKMSPKMVNESGCAVCGKLTPLRHLSRLKHVKNYLHILETKGVTRIERKTDKDPIKEYSGPVLDYSCSRVCTECRRSIRRGTIPHMSLANRLWIGKVPKELECLSYVEKLLVARLRHTCSFVKVSSGMRKMKANIIAFESPVAKVYNILPPPCDEINDVLAILFTGPCHPTPEELKRTPFLVSRKKVASALEWLRLNHCDYADIEISKENLESYPDNGIPVSIQYQSSTTNKVSEGTSVFDNTEEDGTDTGQCSFSVHGLTSELLDAMPLNTVKAMAIQHLNNGGKMMAVGHSEEPVRMWKNARYYPQMFPWLYPYGLGGMEIEGISSEAHIKWALMYHDKRFQEDVNFPFVAFCHSQLSLSSRRSYLVVEQKRFNDISKRLLDLDQNVLSEVTDKLINGEYFTPVTEQEKACFQVMHDLDSVAGNVKGSVTSKKYMRNEIWSMINFLGAPSWYITLSPADIQHPLCIYYASKDEEFKIDLLPYNDRIRLVCANPVAGARFFHHIVQTFIEDVLGCKSKHRGLYGPTKGYYGTVEQQGRLTLHLHMLLSIESSLSPQDLRDRLLKGDTAWNASITSLL